MEGDHESESRIHSNADVDLVRIIRKCRVEQGAVLLGASGGVLIPTGDYKDVGNTGFGAGVDVDYVLSPSGSIGVKLAYNRNDFSDEFKQALADTTGVPIDGHFTIMHYGVHGRLFLSPESKTRPFITIGGGFYNFKVTAEAFGSFGSDSETKGGINGGVGLLFDAGSSAHVAIQGTYHDIFTSESSTQYINAGVAVMFDLGKK